MKLQPVCVQNERKVSARRARTFSLHVRSRKCSCAPRTHEERRSDPARAERERGRGRGGATPTEKERERERERMGTIDRQSYSYIRVQQEWRFFSPVYTINWAWRKILMSHFVWFCANCVSLAKTATRSDFNSWGLFCVFVFTPSSAAIYDDAREGWFLERLLKCCRIHLRVWNHRFIATSFYTSSLLPVWLHSIVFYITLI